MNHAANKQQGFTLIELSLAMAFIAFLLLAIALTIIQIGAIYSQGTTLKEVNQASRDINDDIRRNVLAAGSFSLEDDFIKTGGNAGGRLCLGQFSYVWNFGKAISDNNVNVARKQGTPVRLVKVPDVAEIYCAKNSLGGLANPNIRDADAAEAQELLQPGDHDLALHAFTVVTPPATSIDPVSRQQLYSFMYTIGTSKMSALNADQTACLAPNETNADPLFCTVKDFSLVVRAGSGVN
jgi:hypothetical protein